MHSIPWWLAYFAQLPESTDEGLCRFSVSHHRGETHPSSTVRTSEEHHFLLKTMEAFYHFFLSLYISDKSSNTDSPSQASGDNAVLASLVTSFSLTSDDELDAVRKLTPNFQCNLLNSIFLTSTHSCTAYHKSKTQFGSGISSSVLTSLLTLAYSLRCWNWDLCNGSIKQLTAIFSASDS